MSIYTKLPKARKLIGDWEKTKSGNNRSFKYVELMDISPAVDSVCEQLGICYFFNIGKEEATITLVDAEDPSVTITSTIPVAPASLKGCTPIQEAGALVTYARRYLLLTAFNISVPDQVDSRGIDLSNEPKEDISLNLSAPAVKAAAPAPEVTEQDVTDVALALVDKPSVEALTVYWRVLPQYLKADQRVIACFKDAKEQIEARERMDDPIPLPPETCQPLH